MSSNGTYGTRIASNVTQKDVEIFYSYSPTRNSDDVNNATFMRLPSNLLFDAETEDNDVLEGLKNLKLPLQYFNKKGFYSVYIRPKEVKAVINHVSTLTTYPDVRGIIIDTNMVSELSNELKTNNMLVGYRIIYLKTDGSGEREPYYRIVTSNNKCEPVEQSLSNVNQNTTRYRFNESSNLTFITVTPSVAPSFKSNAEPYIGKTGQEIILVNTKFEPILIDIEMIDKDIDNVATMLEGSQLRSLDNGLVTTFNENNEIYHQSEHYSLKNPETGEPVYEVKMNKTDSIDFSQTLEDK
jgi:hypothetical protein